MTSMFSFCLQADNLEFRHINQVPFSLLYSSQWSLFRWFKNIRTKTISIASFCVAVTIIEGIFFFQTKYVMWKKLRADNLEFQHINQVLFFLFSSQWSLFQWSKTFKPRPLVLHRFVSPSWLLRGFSSCRQSMYHNVNKWFLYYCSFSASCLLQLIWGWLMAIICQVQ